jgi:hypothetical protein
MATTMAKKPRQSRAARLLNTALAGLPKKTQLTYVHYNDDLTDEQTAKILGGQHDEVWEEICDNFIDSEDYGINYLLESALPDPDDRDHLRASDEWQAFVDECRERDESDVLGDLLRNTRRRMVRFHFRRDGEDVSLSDLPEGDVQRAAWLLRLGIEPTTENVAALDEIVANASYGGDLCLLAYVDVRPLAKAVNHLLGDPDARRVRITFTNPELLAINAGNGSGHSARMKAACPSSSATPIWTRAAA